MNRSADETDARSITGCALRLSGDVDDLDPLLDFVGNARCVLIGEATHGTQEFYEQRAELTKRLITEKGFCAVAAEADWPDAYRVNRYVRGRSNDPDALAALSGFRRFPAWMWRNVTVRKFIDWLRRHNEHTGANKAAGFYGLDLYSLHASIEAVLAYLDRVDPDAAERARYRYGCFEDFEEDLQAYGYAATFGLAKNCKEAVINQLVELRNRQDAFLRNDGIIVEDDFFDVEQNARVVKNAEEYYRTMFEGRISSWNLRDQHMADTLDRILNHLDRRAGRARLVVWAHNSHVGDARATELGAAGELNIGQLVRLRYPGDTALVGFSTYTGAVTAASSWGGDTEYKHLRPGLPGSYEELLHRTSADNFLLLLRARDKAIEALRAPRLQRAIGVIYKPESERVSHYFQARVLQQFDALIHIDRTHALEPLDRAAYWPTDEPAETYPTGI